MMTSFSDSDRLKHTNMLAFLRSLQMSSANLIVFVEGDDDPFFYGNLCQSALLRTDIVYKLYNSKDIPSSHKGKAALLELFDYLNTTASLLNALKGKTTCVLFFLDKDVDDLCNRQIVSEHIVYTYYYELENHIVEHGNLNKGCSAAASMDPQDVDCSIVDQAGWLRDAASRWKEWVIFCVFASVFQLKCRNNYGLPSQINVHLTGEIDQDKYNEGLALLKLESGLSDAGFANELARISRIVEDIYQRGEHGKIFKGKWYKYFLAEQIRRVASITPGNIDGIERQILRYIASTLDFTASWTDYFKLPLSMVIDKIKEGENSNIEHTPIV